MQISNQLPQFTEQNTLIIVASTQTADLYHAHAGEINQVAEIRQEKPDGDEQAGRFDRRSKGQMLGIGGVAEKEVKEKIRKNFLKDFKKTLESLDKQTAEQIILLSSPQTKPAVREKIEQTLTTEITVEIDGNFVGEHPDVILEQIKKYQEEKK